MPSETSPPWTPTNGYQKLVWPCQPANYAQLCDTMALFKLFLSPHRPNSHGPELEEAFQTSKQAMWVWRSTTCKGTTASALTGPGVVLASSCSNNIVAALQAYRTVAQEDGGSPSYPRPPSYPRQSNTMRPSKERPWPWPGAWSKKKRYFTQGCDNLVVVTDHKPLVKIFGDHTLAEITKSSLFRLKQRTLPWRFDIVYLPGKSNHAANATSRHPSLLGSAKGLSLGSPSVPDTVESALMTSIRDNPQGLRAISWSLLPRETAADVCRVDVNDPVLASLSPVCESIYAQDGIFLHYDGVVVPPSLRERVLRHLHAAHQGTSRWSSTPVP